MKYLILIVFTMTVLCAEELSADTPLEKLDAVVNAELLRLQSGDIADREDFSISTQYLLHKLDIKINSEIHKMNDKLIIIDIINKKSKGDNETYKNEMIELEEFIRVRSMQIRNKYLNSLYAQYMSTIPAVNIGIDHEIKKVNVTKIYGIYGVRIDPIKKLFDSDLKEIVLDLPK